MRLILESSSSLSVTKLPSEINGNYWVLNGSKNLINVEAKENKWIIKSNTEIKISKSLDNSNLTNINYVDEIILEENNHYYLVDILNKENFILYTIPSYENMDNFIVDYNKVDKITIGNKKSDLNINNNLLKEKELVIEYDKNINSIVLKKLNKDNKLFINNKLCDSSNLVSGDIIFYLGINIYYFGSLLLISNNKNDLQFNSLKLNKRISNVNETKDYTQFIDKDIKLYDKSNYFQRPPRFKRKIETKTFNIDEPTQKENQEEMPLIFTIAPMLTMGMMSLVSGVTALQRVLEGKSTLKDEFSSLLMCGCMMLSMILFPLAQKFYTKMKKKEKERKRRRKYKKYIDKKREEIFHEINFQKQVLIEDNLPIEKVRDIILSRSRNLWERKIEHPDFLEFRLGIGNKKPDIDIKYPESHFTLEEDDLKDIITDLVNESKDLDNVPITLNFRENNKVGIIGDKTIMNSFIDNLMLQIMAYHGYDMLRVIILTNDINKNYWDKYRNLTHLWNNEKSIRYYATNKEDTNKLTSILMEEYNYRKEILSETKDIQFNPYYLIFTDDVMSVKSNVFINEILKNHSNLGYSLVMCVEKLDMLPNEASMFINIAKDMSGLFTNQMTDTNQIAFKPDLVNFSLRNCITNICNIPMDINSGKFVLPKKYSFLEMYDVGNVEQLNILNKWKNNDVINSLSAPIGIDEQGELFNVDLHEKAHGPHGLVAGTTGSGKSEWIITYILSMAINYSPEEVQFVLIDYKGGGLALTFDNQENGIKLPHVVGTITNLDVVEIKRSLASIESELKRRQSMFKNAREKLNESSMDIYKYQENYRQGNLSEPMSHLFIISDEFAELKAQQPEFMEQLISTARIGRSLGIHLILATQKPSGVVNDQIWSNSKFKVCLKVQDKGDSNEMIKCPDAAMLKDTGRFYFQVGYNEFFALGQCAYAGCPYFESDKKITTVDSKIEFVNNIGVQIKTGDVEKKNMQFVHKGEELPNVLNYIIETANTQDLNIKPLWLNRIPKIIYVDKLKNKYNWQKEDFVLNPIIGEFDEPSKQLQGLLTLPISEEGNTIIYGSSGSGKELLLSSLLYSLISNYSLEELNIYIMDFGSEVLNNFANAPQVGDVIYSDDTEKIENLFKLIKQEMAYRRKLFSSYNGNYQDYIKKCKETESISNIIIIINNYEVFSSLSDSYNEIIADLIRDSVRYGIYFIFSVTNCNGIRNKIVQNIKKKIVLQMVDEYDYRTILGNTNNVIPSKFYGRGLVKINKVVEFQTAYSFESEKLYDLIKDYCFNLLKQKNVKAKTIPILPKELKYSEVVKDLVTINNIPIGIAKEDLGIASINLANSVSYLLSARSFDDIIPFIDMLLYILNNTSEFTTFVFDTKYIYDNFEYNNISYNSTTYIDILQKINNYSVQVDGLLQKNNGNKKYIKNVKDIVCVIIGAEKFVTSLAGEEKDLFNNIIEKSKSNNKIHFILIDGSNNIRKLEYEPWYKETVDSSEGLWIGDGFSEQYIIKSTRNIRTQETMNNGYGYIIKDGNTKFVKLCEK